MYSYSISPYLRNCHLAQPTQTTRHTSLGATSLAALEAHGCALCGYRSNSTAAANSHLVFRFRSF